MVHTFILLMMIYSPSARDSGVVTSAEFNSIESCIAAGDNGKMAFSGFGAKFIYTCNPK